MNMKKIKPYQKKETVLVCRLLVIVFLIMISTIIGGCDLADNKNTSKYSDKNVEMQVIVYTGDYSTNKCSVRNDVIISNPEEIISVQNYVDKIKQDCPNRDPLSISSLELSRMIDILYKGETVTLFSQGHDYFYLYTEAESKYYYLGEYYKDNYYGSFREVVFEAANITD